jgi:hypothetical protein
LDIQFEFDEDVIRLSYLLGFFVLSEDVLDEDFFRDRFSRRP